MKEIKVQFDLTLNGDMCDGNVSINKDVVIADDGKNKAVFNISNIKEAVQYTDIGCGRLEFSVENGSSDGSDNIIVCRFSMTCVAEIGEFVKVFNHYKKTGELLEINISDLPICPKCHRHLLKNMNVCIFCVKKSYVFGRAFTYFKPYLKSVIITGLVLTLANVISALMPLLNSRLIDNYLVPVADASPLFASRTSGIIFTALLMAALFAVSRVMTIISSRISNRIGSRFSNDLRLLVYDKIQELSLSSMQRKTSGNLIHRVTKDTEKIKNFFNEQGRYLIEQIIMFAVVLTVLFCTNVLLTITVLIPIPLGIMLISKF